MMSDCTTASHQQTYNSAQPRANELSALKRKLESTNGGDVQSVTSNGVTDMVLSLMLLKNNGRKGRPKTDENGHTFLIRTDSQLSV
jgi:hypothetical protein